MSISAPTIITVAASQRPVPALCPARRPAADVLSISDSPLLPRTRFATRTSFYHRRTFQSKPRSLLVRCSMTRGVSPLNEASGDIPPPPWQRLPDRSARRRREPISREAIVKAAVDLLDREGLPALSMRRLGDELGAGAASLYWHVGSKDGLLDLVLDEIIGEGQVPDPDPARWQEQLKEVARTMRRTS